MFNVGNISFETAVENVEHALSPKKGKLVVNNLQTGYTALANSLRVLETYRDNCKFTAPSKFEIANELLIRYSQEAYTHGTSRNS